MRAMILSDPEFHGRAPDIFKAVRRKKYKLAYDLIYGDLGLNRDEYDALGITLTNILQRKASSHKFSHIYRLSGQMASSFGLNGRTSDDPKRVALVQDLTHVAYHYHPSHEGEAPPYTVLIDYVISAATILLASGIEAAALSENQEMLAQSAHATVLRFRQPFSITDVRDTVRALLQHRPITDWILAEEVEELRPHMHQRLLSFLRSPKAVEWLAEIIHVPEAVTWLCEQMRTPVELALLRGRVQELRSGASNTRVRHGEV